MGKKDDCIDMIAKKAKTFFSDCGDDIARCLEKIKTNKLVQKIDKQFSLDAEFAECRSINDVAMLLKTKQKDAFDSLKNRFSLVPATMWTLIEETITRLDFKRDCPGTLKFTGKKLSPKLEKLLTNIVKARGMENTGLTINIVDHNSDINGNAGNAALGVRYIEGPNNFKNFSNEQCKEKELEDTLESIVLNSNATINLSYEALNQHNDLLSDPFNDKWWPKLLLHHEMTHLLELDTAWSTMIEMVVRHYYPDLAIRRDSNYKRWLWIDELVADVTAMLVDSSILKCIDLKAYSLLSRLPRVCKKKLQKIFHETGCAGSDTHPTCLELAPWIRTINRVR
jgi:hypothetical protein